MIEEFDVQEVIEVAADENEELLIEVITKMVINVLVEEELD